MKKLLWLLLILLPVPALAQFSVWSEPILNQGGQPVVGASVNLCATQPTFVVPCGGTTLVTIYQSFAGTVISQPIFTDLYGRASLYAAPGNYFVQISGPGLITTSVPITIGGGSAGGGSPIIIGSGLPNQAPICIVDGVQNISIPACIAYLQGLGLHGGTIWSRYPEVLPVGVFAATNWHGLLVLGNGTSDNSHCFQVAPFNCWLTDGPLQLPDGMSIEGVESPNFGFSTSRGTIISFSLNYPSPLGVTPTPPGSPTGTCADDPVNGTLSNGTYFWQVDESSNALGNTQNANTQATPLHSAVSARFSTTCSAGTATQSITFTMPAQQTSTNTLFNAVDVGVYSSTVSGQEQQNLPGTDLICPNGTGQVDKRGCKGAVAGVWTPGTIKITGVPAVAANSGRMAPCYTANGNDTTGLIVDCSNPLIYLGWGTPNVAPNSFQSAIRHVMLQGSPTGSGSTLANEPAIAFLNASCQENCGAEDMIATGAFGFNNQTVMFYTGFKAGNSFLRDIHVPSNAGPSSCTNMTDYIFDGRAGGNGGARYLDNASANGNCGTGSYRIGVLGVNANVLATGLHIESKGDGIFVDDLGGGTFWATSSTVPITFASQHYSASADVSEGFVGKQGDTHASFQDDVNGQTVTPGQGRGAAYSMKSFFGNVKAPVLIANTGNSCTNGELVLSAGWGTTAAKGSVAGTGQTCQWTITSAGTGQAANPTITDNLTNVLPAANVVCEMRMVGGTGTTTLINQTTLSATAPIFTFGGTPVATNTYIVVRRCGP